MRFAPGFGRERQWRAAVRVIRVSLSPVVKGDGLLQSVIEPVR